MSGARSGEGHVRLPLLLLPDAARLRRNSAESPLAATFTQLPVVRSRKTDPETAGRGCLIPEFGGGSVDGGRREL